MYTGGYPDETYVMTLLNKKEFSQFGRVFGPKMYLYIGGIFAITFLGFLMQLCCVPEKKEEIKEKKDNEENKENKENEQDKEKLNQSNIGQNNAAAVNPGENTNNNTNPNPNPNPNPNQ